MRRFFALLLCGLVLLSTGCAYAAVSSQRGEGDYELFFREADLTGVPGGDALRAEIIHLEEEQRQDPQEVARILLTALLEGHDAVESLTRCSRILNPMQSNP